MELVVPLVVSFLNRKGGVGKTSSVHNIGGLFARDGRRVLLIDMDPQFSLTQGLLGARPALSLPKEHTVTALFNDACDPDPDRIIRTTAFERLHLAPGSATLNSYNLPDPQLQSSSLQSALTLFVNEVRDRYDIILIDCPPNLNMSSWCALLSSDACVVPTQPEDYGAQGLIHVAQMIEQAAAGPNPRLQLMGYLLTMVRPRLGIHIAYRDQLKLQYGSAVFAAEVPDLTHFKEAITVQMPISHYKPKSKATLAIRAVAEEMMARARGEQFPVENVGVDERRIVA
ncbi:ParA family protein [Frigoriglobus tundricola]|uniref:ParA family partition protein n=1 Tax=Frigoriglobus tundricola TaxID=2774151 RepID=A0A6M5Z4J5_9BACT|nr:ParA family protein [Frigoriglobus tundricola]QJX01338.1 ParA family partition protein [Frigoriglobus tundricola]